MAIEVRELLPEDEAAALAALNAFCHTRGAAAPERSRAGWDWAYRGNPAGRRAWLALDEGRVVAHFAALPHAVWLDGREARFGEIVDAFVEHGRRRGLQREGLFARTGRALMHAHGGAEGELFYYGWPTPAEWRMGSGLLDYEVVRTQTVLTREPGEGPAKPPAEVEELERFDHQARWLWDRCCVGWGASAIRDEAFLNWRFVDRPEHAYRLFGVRDAEGILRGFAAYRHGDWLEPNTALVCDWLVPPEEPEVGELLLRAVLARARADRAATVTTLLVDWTPWFDTFQRRGFLVVDSDRFLFGVHFARKFDDLWLRDHWWYTLADSVVC